MTTIPNLVEDLEDKVQGGTSEKRAVMLRRITDLFVANASRVTDEHAAVFDDVFELLIKEIETKAVLELSGRIASVDNAPERLIRRLANDDLDRDFRSRAGAVQSTCRARPYRDRPHQRPGASRGDRGPRADRREGHRSSGSARRHDGRPQGCGQRRRALSDSSLRNLINRATDDSDLANAVARRRELPPQMFRHLLTRATDQVRQRLLDAARPGTQKAINNILAEISLNVEKAAASRRSYSAAQQTVLELQKQGGLDAEALVAAAKALKVEEMVAVLAALTSVSVEVIDRFLDDASDDPLLILCKAIDLDWSSAAAVLAGKLGVPKLRDSRAEGANKKYRKLTDVFGAARAAVLAGARKGGAGRLTFFATRIAPATISAIPSQLVPDGRSPRNRNAKIATSTTLSLSIGATCEASPSLSARK